MTMRRMLAIVFALMLPLTALAEEEIVLEDTETYWGETVHSRVVDGYLIMTVDGDAPFQPVVVKEGFVEAVRALEASGEQYNLEPNLMEAELRALLGDSLTGGAKVWDIGVQHDQIILFLEGPSDGLTLRVATWNGKGYDVLDNPTFPARSWLDTVHYNDGHGLVMYVGPSEFDGWLAYLVRSEEGVWRLGVRTDTLVWDYEWEWQSIIDWKLVEKGRNDGYYYGDYPLETDFEDFDASACSVAWEEGLALLDRSGWAVVNNPNPTDCLPLQAAPDEGAESLGAFYNRTPVRVISDEGEWSQVVIGEDGLSGWMMTKYLAFGEAMDEVACAFPLGLARKDGEYPCAVRATPEESAPETWSFFPDYDFVIGVLGDEWYIVMEPHEGWVGYVPREINERMG